MEVGEIVRVWFGNAWRTGKFEGVVGDSDPTGKRRIRRRGWMKVFVRNLKNGEFVWVLRRVPPDHIRRI